MTTRTFYRVITPDYFAPIHANTLEEAREKIKEWGTANPHATEENKKYWEELAKQCRITKVTEIIEDVEEGGSHEE